ncbi:hypothetical protein HDU91_007211, partial [Kappamyces sp. JEL0680]
MKRFEASAANEKYLNLPDGRTLAYEANGNPQSNRVIVFYSGTLSVGVADISSPYLASNGFHYIAPTMPGYGLSSAPLPGVSFPRTIASDLSALLRELHPDTGSLQLYICGGSFGTIIAQMLYGAELDVFPAARHIKGMLLLATFPPVRCSRNPEKASFDWMKHMNWPNWISAGPPSRIWPLGMLMTLTFASVIVSKISTKPGSEAFIKQVIFDHMDSHEKELYKAWRETLGVDEDYLVESLASMNRRSIANSQWGLKN